MPLIRKRAAPSAEPARDPEALIEMLRDASADRRSLAARSLAGVPGSVAALGEALGRETDARIREAILTSLATFDEPSAFDAVLSLLRSDDAGLRAGALETLREMPRSAAERLPLLLQDTDSDIRILACEIARDIPPREAAALLCRTIETDPLVNVCAAAIDALAEVGSEADLPALERGLSRFPNEPFIAFAAEAARSQLTARRSQ